MFLPAGGIGEACALAFAKQGAGGIVVSDVDVDLARRIAEGCRAVATAEGFRAEGLKIDVADEASVSRATEHASSALGRIDYCVNAAGVSYLHYTTTHYTILHLRSVLDIWSPFLTPDLTMPFSP